MKMMVTSKPLGIAVFLASCVGIAVSLPQTSGVRTSLAPKLAAQRPAEIGSMAMRLKGGGLFKRSEIAWPVYEKDEIPPYGTLSSRTIPESWLSRGPKNA
jgi:hypothetical protein